MGRGDTTGKGIDISEMKLAGTQYNEEVRRKPNSKSIKESTEYYTLNCTALYQE
jgi:hypothetical protein